MTLTGGPMSEWRAGRDDGRALDADRVFVAAYEAHQPRLVGWLRSRVHDDAAAEDLAQEACLRLLVELRAGRPPLVPGAWLWDVARNLMVSRARHAQVVRRAAPALLVRTGDGDPTAHAAIDVGDVAALAKALDRFSPRDRETLLLAAAGWPNAAIAQRLGTTDGAARTRLHRLRHQLRVLLEDEGAAGIPSGSAWARSTDRRRESLR